MPDNSLPAQLIDMESSTDSVIIMNWVGITKRGTNLYLQFLPSAQAATLQIIKLPSAVCISGSLVKVPLLLAQSMVSEFTAISTAQDFPGKQAEN